MSQFRQVGQLGQLQHRFQTDKTAIDDSATKSSAHGTLWSAMPTELGSPSAMLASETADRRPWLWCRLPSPMPRGSTQLPAASLRLVGTAVLTVHGLVPSLREGEAARGLRAPRQAERLPRQSAVRLEVLRRPGAAPHPPRPRRARRAAEPPPVHELPAFRLRGRAPGQPARGGTRGVSGRRTHPRQMRPDQAEPTAPAARPGRLAGTRGGRRSASPKPPEQPERYRRAQFSGPGVQRRSRLGGWVASLARARRGATGEVICVR